MQQWAVDSFGNRRRIRVRKACGTAAAALDFTKNSGLFHSPAPRKSNSSQTIQQTGRGGAPAGPYPARWSSLSILRRRGYAKQMLSLALEECHKMGMRRVLVTCDKENAASARTIRANGGVLENEVEAGGRTTQRYWIALS